MLEFIFFHEKPFQLFVDYLNQQQQTYESAKADECFQIFLPEELDDERLDDIEEKYDELLDMNQQLVDEAEGQSEKNYHMASVLVTLADGSTSIADVPPDLLSRIMSTVSPVEFAVIVDAIVKAVENPDQRSYCERVRDGDVDFDQPTD